MIQTTPKINLDELKDVERYRETLNVPISGRFAEYKRRKKERERITENLRALQRKKRGEVKLSETYRRSRPSKLEIESIFM